MLVAGHSLLSWTQAQPFLDPYRPPYVGTPMRLHVLKQMWHLEAIAEKHQYTPRVLIVGSSSVVNGIDENAMQQQWEGKDVHSLPFNYGVTGLMAYELLMLKPLLLAEDVTTIVYPYSSFAFSNELHPDAISIRWNSAEALRLGLLDWREPRSWDRFLIGTTNEYLPLLRYGPLLRDYLVRTLFGRIAPLPYPWDYDPSRTSWIPKDDMPPVKPVSDAEWTRRAYVESSLEEDTLGYRALQHFCEEAVAKGKRFIVLPAPEAYFGIREDPYMVGINKTSIESRVKTIAHECGAEWLPRESIAYIEQDAGYFLDSVHLGAKGRDIFSRWLADRILELPQ